MRVIISTTHAKTLPKQQNTSWQLFNAISLSHAKKSLRQQMM
jgi:hypothetical protein